MSRIMKKPDERRKELLNIGFDLYMEKGMAGLSIKEIVEQAHVAIGLFYYYFKSKEEFVEEALNNYVAQNLESVKELLEAEKTASEKLDAVFSAFFQFADRVKPYVREQVHRTRQNYIFINQVLEHMLPVVEQVIEDGSTEGIFHVKSARVAASYILYGLSGFLQFSADDGEDENEVVRELVYETLGMMPAVVG